MASSFASPVLLAAEAQLFADLDYAGAFEVEGRDHVETVRLQRVPIKFFALSFSVR